MLHSPLTFRPCYTLTLSITLILAPALTTPILTSTPTFTPSSLSPPCSHPKSCLLVTPRTSVIQFSNGYLQLPLADTFSLTMNVFTVEFWFRIDDRHVETTALLQLIRETHANGGQRAHANRSGRQKAMSTPPLYSPQPLPIVQLFLCYTTIPYHMFSVLHFPFLILYHASLQPLLVTHHVNLVNVAE